MAFTRFEKINVSSPDTSLITQAARLLKEGQAIAFPTETVYGLGASVLSAKGLEALYEIKGRPKDKPLQVMIANLDMLQGVVEEIPQSARKLMEKFWPGPLTLILPGKSSLSQIVTGVKNREREDRSENRDSPLRRDAGLGTVPIFRTVAVRFPDHPVPVQLIQTLGHPIATTSANLSGQPAPVTAEEVRKQLQGKISLILDGGRCPHAQESTIVDCTETALKILRVGAIDSRNIIS